MPANCLELPVTPPFNRSELEPLRGQSLFNITCMGSNDNNNHSVTLFNQNISSEDLTVEPLAPSTSYECWIQCDNQMCINTPAHFDTCSMKNGPLSLELAGVIGGLIGVVISVLVVAGITGIIICTVMLVRRRR